MVVPVRLDGGPAELLDELLFRVDREVGRLHRLGFFLGLRDVGFLLAHVDGDGDRFVRPGDKLGDDLFHAHATGADVAVELKRIADMAALAAKNGIEPHAGHGLTYENVVPVAAIPQLAELNIGHYLIGEAIFTGLEDAVRRMRALMDEAR